MGKSIDNSFNDTKHKDSSLSKHNYSEQGIFVDFKQGVKHYMNPLHIY